jgi:hypothetical protein
MQKRAMASPGTSDGKQSITAGQSIDLEATLAFLTIVFPFIYLFIYCSSGVQTPCFAHARQVICH